MVRPSALIAFPTCRDIWAPIDGIAELLAAADSSLQRRMSGNQRMPRWSSSERSEMLAIGIRALQVWANGEPPRDEASRPEVARKIHAAVSRLLSAIAWPRWLFLERAFFTASTTGDLLFAAIVLRTMCEEVQRLHSVDLDSNSVALLAGSTASADQDRLRLYFSVAWASLGDLPQDTVLNAKNWPSMNLIAKAKPRLERARSALNSYVHPNYGSHIAALFPERAASAQILLEAVGALYEEFFALSWAEKPISGHSIPVPVGPTQSWPRSVRHLLSITLPEARRGAGIPALATVLKAPALVDWLKAPQDRHLDVLGDQASDPLFSKLPGRMWEGARPSDIVHLASARRAEELLSSEFQQGAPEPSDQVSWLQFNALSLQLAMLVDQAKVAPIKAQLVRQLTQGNCIGVWLCVRSLIEHRALAVWLPQTLGVSWNAMSDEVHAGAPLPENATEVEGPLAKFLASQAKATKEERRPWVMNADGNVRTAWLNVGNVVESAFPQEDRFRTVHALASAVMHGRSARGRDLMIDARSATTRARNMGLLVLERICNKDEEMDHLSAALVQFTRLEHVAEFGGTSGAATDAIARKAFGVVTDQLLPGTDFSGDGTAGDPFCLEPHLQFHQTSRILLEQLGVDVMDCGRVLDRDDAGHLCDRWRAPDRDYWIRTRI